MDLLDEQIAYYRARAPEYDEWFFRKGRWAGDESHRRAWFAELATVEDALRAARPRGRVLELACGTGLWTRHLVEHASDVTALDASPEVLARNRARVGRRGVRYLEADLFRWRPTERWDFVFFGFWLSHVPPGRFGDFWERVGAALAPNGRVFFVDNARDSRNPPRDHRASRTGFVTERKLNDGRRFRIVKIFYEPAELSQRLAALGWSGSVRSSGDFFLYGEVGADREAEPTT